MKNRHDVIDTAISVIHQSCTKLSLLDHLICMVPPGDLTFEDTAREGLNNFLKEIELNLSEIANNLIILRKLPDESPSCH